MKLQDNYMSFLASYLNRSHDLPDCACEPPCGRTIMHRDILRDVISQLVCKSGS